MCDRSPQHIPGNCPEIDDDLLDLMDASWGFTGLQLFGGQHGTIQTTSTEDHMNEAPDGQDRIQGVARAAAAAAYTAMYEFGKTLGAAGTEWTRRGPWHELAEHDRADITATTSLLYGSGVTMQSLHDRRLQAMLLQGWRYGAELNLQTKESPECQLYGALPLARRVADDLFQTVARAVMTTARQHQNQSKHANRLALDGTGVNKDWSDR